MKIIINFRTLIFTGLAVIHYICMCLALPLPKISVQVIVHLYFSHHRWRLISLVNVLIQHFKVQHECQKVKHWEEDSTIDEKAFVNSNTNGKYASNKKRTGNMQCHYDFAAKPGILCRFGVSFPHKRNILTSEEVDNKNQNVDFAKVINMITWYTPKFVGLLVIGDGVVQQFS